MEIEQIKQLLILLKEHSIDDLTKVMSLLGQTEKSSNDDSHWKIGKNYFIRTVTFYYTGKLIKVTGKELVLEDAAWIADTGRFSTALKEGELTEVEPYQDGELIIGRGAIIDASIWNNIVPRDVK